MHSTSIVRMRCDPQVLGVEPDLIVLFRRHAKRLHTTTGVCSLFGMIVIAHVSYRGERVDGTICAGRAHCIEGMYHVTNEQPGAGTGGT